MLITYLLLLIIAIFLNKIIKKNKIIILGYIIFLSILWTGNVDGPDIANYITHYDFSDSGDFGEKNYGDTYKWLLSFFKRNDFSFQQFRLIISLFGLILLFGSITIWIKNISYVLAAYMTTIYFMDGIQLRNFLALPFLYIGILVLFSEKKHKKIIFVLFIVFASTIHSAFISYLLFLMIPEKMKNDEITHKVIVGMFIVLFIVLYFGRSYLSNIVILISSIDQERILSYSRNKTSLGPFIPLFIQIFSIYMISLFQKSEINYCSKSNCNNTNNHILRICLWINTISLLMVSLSLLHLTFYRLIRNLILLNIGTYTLLRNKDKKNTLAIIVYITAWILIDYLILGDIESLITPFFKSFIFKI